MDGHTVWILSNVRIIWGRLHGFVFWIDAISIHFSAALLQTKERPDWVVSASLPLSMASLMKTVLLCSPREAKVCDLFGRWCPHVDPFFQTPAPTVPGHSYETFTSSSASEEWIKSPHNDSIWTALNRCQLYKTSPLVGKEMSSQVQMQWYVDDKCCTKRYPGMTQCFKSVTECFPCHL